MKAPRRTHAVDLLKELHWLPVKYRVEFKIATFVYKPMNLKEPKYLSEFCSIKRVQSIDKIGRSTTTTSSEIAM